MPDSTLSNDAEAADLFFWFKVGFNRRVVYAACTYVIAICCGQVTEEHVPTPIDRSVVSVQPLEEVTPMLRRSRVGGASKHRIFDA